MIGKAYFHVRGSVKLRARVLEPNKRVTFPLVAFDPKEPCVDKIEIEAPNNGDEINSTVYISDVADSDAGIALAEKVLTAVLNRISFWHKLGIADGELTGHQFIPINQPPNLMSLEAADTMKFTGDVLKYALGLPADKLKLDLEQPKLRGEDHFGLLRSALLSTSSVEKFMHLYHILLMLFFDSQKKVDKFIVSENPYVPQRPYKQPRKKKPEMETVYTRLRNQFAHKRPNVTLEETKTEMEEWLGELIELTKRAIQS